MDKGRKYARTGGLIAAAILWALVLIGLLAPPPPKPHEPDACAGTAMWTD